MTTKATRGELTIIHTNTNTNPARHWHGDFETDGLLLSDPGLLWLCSKNRREPTKYRH